jgi:predicted DNA-binding protein
MGESKIFSVRVPAEELERLKEAKWDLRKPVNQIVRDAINQYLDREYKKVVKKGKSSK